jgi:hypothetical protein
MAHTIPLEDPCAEMDGVAPGNLKVLGDCDAAEVLNRPAPLRV